MATQQYAGAVKLACAGAAVLLAAGIAGCAETDDQPGDPQVYEEIAASKSCPDLQVMFDRATGNHDRATTDFQRRYTTAYMKAANDRMKEIGCYD